MDFDTMVFSGKTKLAFCSNDRPFVLGTEWFLCVLRDCTYLAYSLASLFFFSSSQTARFSR